MRYLRRDKLNSGQYRLDLYPISVVERQSRSFIGNRGRGPYFNDEEESDGSSSSNDCDIITPSNFGGQDGSILIQASPTVRIENRLKNPPATERIENKRDPERGANLDRQNTFG